MGALDPHVAEDSHGAEPAEAALWRRWRQEGDTAARNALVDMHLPYARLMASTYFARRFNDEIPYDDYLQMATMGMIEAMERFDPGVGVRFRTFASRRIHGSIVDGIERETEKQQQIAARARIDADRRESIRGGEHEADACAAPRPARTAEQALQYVAEAGLAFALSWILDGSRMIDSGEPVADMPFYKSAQLRQLRQRILELMQTLPEKERSVIELHYFHDLLFEEIATRLGVSRSRISQAHKSALAKLRENVRSPGEAFDLLA